MMPLYIKENMKYTGRSKSNTKRQCVLNRQTSVSLDSMQRFWKNFNQLGESNENQSYHTIITYGETNQLGNFGAKHLFRESFSIRESSRGLIISNQGYTRAAHLCQTAAFL